MARRAPFPGSCDESSCLWVGGSRPQRKAWGSTRLPAEVFVAENMEPVPDHSKPTSVCETGHREGAAGADHADRRGGRERGDRRPSDASAVSLLLPRWPDWGPHRMLLGERSPNAPLGNAAWQRAAGHRQSSPLTPLQKRVFPESLRLLFPVT